MAVSKEDQNHKICQFGTWQAIQIFSAAIRVQTNTSTLVTTFYVNLNEEMRFKN